MKQIRRCVIGSDANGLSYTQFNNYAPTSITVGKTGGAGPLWMTHELPIANTGSDDLALGPYRPLPDANGTVFTFFCIPPESEMGAEALAHDMASVNTDHQASFTNRQRHPGMHKTNTLDYAVILEGEVWLLTDKDEILLKAGDTAVCRGASHHWNNRSSEPCVAIFVIIGAQPL